MSLFEFGKKKVVGSLFPKVSPNTVATSRSRQPKMVIGSDGSGGGNLSGGGGTHNVSRFSPVTDDLEQPSVVDQWVPKSGAGLNKLFRYIYLRDPICGPTVDLMSTLPFSSFSLLGINDKSIMEVYENCISELDIDLVLPGITTEFLVLGKVCISLMFNEERGYFNNIFTHDPDFLKITPIPIAGFSPKVDARVSPGQKEFMMSKDERDVKAKKSIPSQFIKQLEAGNYVPLDPETTLYLPRKSGINDHIGTSLYTRIVNLWAIEKALINANVIAVRRRAASIMHVKAGIEGQWEPTPEECSAVADLFMQADEDPVGAIVVTRNGIEAQDVREGNLTWKLAEEWSFLTEAKLRALGIGEDFLSGNAAYNTTEQVLSVFVENLRNLREFMVNAIFYRKIFRQIALANGFIKQTESNLQHRVRTTRKSKKLSRKDAEDCELSDLIIPRVQWEKQLRPEADSSYLEILSTMEEKGLPVSLKTWASAGGLDLTKLVDSMKDDSETRNKIAMWKKKNNKDDDDGGMFASINFTPEITLSNYKDEINKLPLFYDNKFFSLSKEDIENMVYKYIIEKPVKKEWPNFVKANTCDDLNKNLLSYVLNRLKLASCPVDNSVLSSISDYITKNCDDVVFMEKGVNELLFIKQSFKPDLKHGLTKNSVRLKEDEWKESLSGEIPENLEKNRVPMIPEGSSNILTGFDT